MKSLICHKTASFIIFMALLSCVSIATAATSDSNQTTATEVRKEINEALQAIGSYSAEQRDAAVIKAREALAKTDARIEELEQKIHQNWQPMSEEARQQAHTTLKALQKQRTEIAEWYGGLKHSSVNAWEEIKKGFSASYTELGKSLEKARQEF